MSTTPTAINATFAAGKVFSAMMRAYERVTPASKRFVPDACARAATSPDVSPGNRADSGATAPAVRL